MSSYYITIYYDDRDTESSVMSGFSSPEEALTIALQTITGFDRPKVILGKNEANGFALIAYLNPFQQQWDYEDIF